MVSKIEPFLILVIILFTYIGFSIQEEGKVLTKKYSKQKKDVSIYQPQGVEVNSTGISYRYRAKNAVLLKGVWHFDKFWLKSSDIKSLTSKKASKDKRYIILTGNVKLHKVDGSFYKAQKVIYDTKKKIAKSKGKFWGEKGKSWVKGIDFYYITEKKITYAKKVFAHYDLEDKKSFKAKSKTP
jgi:hypothetical protein